MTTIEARLEQVRTRMAGAVQRAGRDPGSVTLVAVSKGRPVSAILEAYNAGQRDFGENRGPELVRKVPDLPADIRWHFIGSLQRRKVRLVRPVTMLLHSLDRESLIAEWSKGDGVAPPALMQVNISGEQQKHGLAPGEVAMHLDTAQRAGVVVVGLMTMPPQADDPEDSRPYFSDLRRLRDTVATTATPLSELSMGMTDDFEVGIEEGATLIRVGRAIFGPVES